MPSINLSDIAKGLGADLLNGLRTDLLSHVTDPVQIDLLTRNTAKIAAAGLALVGASGAVLQQAQDDYNAGLAVVLSLASAANEDAATARDNALAKIGGFVNNFLTVALNAAIRAIPIAAI